MRFTVRQRSTLISLIVCAILSLAGLSYAQEGPMLPPDTEPVEPGPGQKVFPYYNPVYPGDGPHPAIWRVEDYFYTAVTGNGSCAP